MKGVGDRAPTTFAADEFEVAQQAELVRAGGGSMPTASERPAAGLVDLGAAGRRRRVMRGSQLPGYAGGAARAIWIVGAQKVVPDLDTALRRVEDHCLPLESTRTKEAYGWPSAVNRLLILNAEHQPGRGTVLLLREAIGF
jgi:hypothetical protein